MTHSPIHTTDRAMTHAVLFLTNNNTILAMEHSEAMKVYVGPIYALIKL